MATVINPVIQRIVALRWSTVSRHLTIPAFLKDNHPALKLVFTDEHVGKVIEAGEKWLTAVPDSVLHLNSEGPLGEAMFCSKLKDVVSHNLDSQIRLKVANLREQAIRDKSELNEVVFSAWREEAVTHVEATVNSLHLLPAKRSVSILYRNSEIPEVAVSSLAEHIDYAVVAVFKAAAVAREVIPALDCEAMMGFASAPGDADLVVQVTWFDKAGLLPLFALCLLFDFKMFCSPSC